MVCAAGRVQPLRSDAARNEDEEQTARAALAELSERYWYPIYAFLRRQVRDADRAEDLTQGFFCELIEKSELARADPDRGRFRSFLLTAARHYLARQKENEAALKRGGGHTLLSFDRQAGESRLSFEPADYRTPERAFEHDWAVNQLEAAIERLRLEYESSGRSELFAALKPWLSGQPEGDQTTLAKQLGMEPSACKVALHRLRRRMGLALRAEVAETVESPREVDEELALLFRALAAAD